MIFNNKQIYIIQKRHTDNAVFVENVGVVEVLSKHATETIIF